MSVNKSFYDKKTGATQTDPDLALRHTLILKQSLFWQLPIPGFGTTYNELVKVIISIYQLINDQIR